jgi:hypothetical protein
VRGRSFLPVRLAADSVVCVVLIKRHRVAQCLGVAYVNLEILASIRTSNGVPKWNREMFVSHLDGRMDILRNASVRVQGNGWVADGYLGRRLKPTLLRKAS